MKTVDADQIPRETNFNYLSFICADRLFVKKKNKKKQHLIEAQVISPILFLFSRRFTPVQRVALKYTRLFDKHH